MIGEEKKAGWGLKLIVIVACIAVLVILNMLTEGKFLQPSNLKTIAVNASVPTFTAWAFVFIFASGFIDLSLGAVIVLAANVAGTFGNSLGYPGLVVTGLITGVLLMTLNFTVFQVTKIPSWIAGLGLTMVYEAISSFYSEQRLQMGLRVVSLESQFRALGRAPLAFVVVLIGLVVAYILYNRTTIGLDIRAMGDNQAVARNMGIKLGRTVILSGVVAGIFVGCAAFMKESFAGTVNAVTGLSSLSQTFQPLAAALLSQALGKHINIIVAVIASTLFVMAIFNFLTLMNVPSGTWQETVLGISVIVFGVLANRNTKEVVK
ncbi:MAG: ABC transporter permease [Eubacterium sp.]|nr:ABC transporter permease [Eubacterium sp.]